MRRRCLIFEELNLAVLPVFLIATACVGEVWFIRCSERVKRLAARAVIRSGGRQGHVKVFPHDASYRRNHENVLIQGRRHAGQRDRLRTALRQFGKSGLYDDLLVYLMSLACFENAYTDASLQEVAERKVAEGWRVSIARTRAGVEYAWTDGGDGAISTTPYLYFVYAAFRFLLAVALLPILVGFPLINLGMFVWKGVRPSFGPNQGGRVSKEVLWVHRLEIVRLNYFLENEFKESFVSRSAHMPMATSLGFEPAKRAWIENNGGEVFEVRGLRAGAGFVIGTVFLDYWRLFGAMLPDMFRFPCASVQFVRQFLVCVHLICLSRLILDAARPRAVYLETETSLFGRVLSIEARRRNINAVSMIHGAGGQLLSASRFCLQFTDLMTFGADDESLSLANPNLTRCVPVGIAEFDEAEASNSGIANKIAGKRGEYRIVGFFPSLYTYFTDEQSHFSGTPYLRSVCLDMDEARDFCERQLQPFVEWVRRNDDILVVVKTKRRAPYGSELNHPWIKGLFSRIPEARLIDVSETDKVADVVKLCDVAMTTGSSTVTFLSLLSEVPCVCLNFLFSGYEGKYHPLFVAGDGDELVRHLDAVLGDPPAPESYLNAVLANWYGDGELDRQTMSRMSACLEAAIAAAPRADGTGARKP